jgi:GNAT superfamily N-acetyltransferase
MGEAVERVTFTMREGRPGDHALVFSSWLGSDRFSRAGQACSRVYQDEQERLVRDILARPGVILRVAVLPDDDDAILGWSVTAPAASVVHYVYVKKGVRRGGIASALLGDMLGRRCEYTHQPVIHPFRAPSVWVFNPYRNFR